MERQNESSEDPAANRLVYPEVEMAMKCFFLCLGFLVGLAGWTGAQELVDDPQAGLLVDCGGEKAVVLNHTESKDGRFALGWTLRPNRKKDPVDWSLHLKEDPGFFDKYSVSDDDGDMNKGNYLVVNGVLNLTTKKFTPLPGNDPYFPGRNHYFLSATWSEDQHGTRYAVGNNEARFGTADLWLVTINAGGSHTQTLTVAADKAVRAYMRKRDPKDYQRYETSFEGSGGIGAVFTAKSVNVHFDTGIPKDEKNYDDGSITFSLPGGKVVAVTKK